MTLGEKIRMFRERAHMSQKELAEHMGRAQSTLCCIEKDTRKCDGDLLYKISKALDVPVSELVDDPQEITAQDRIKRESQALGDKIAEARRSRRIRNTNISAKMGISPDRLYKIERGEEDARKLPDSAKEILIESMPEIDRFFEYTLDDYKKDREKQLKIFNQIMNIYHKITEGKSVAEITIAMGISRSALHRFINVKLDYPRIAFYIYKMIMIDNSYKDELLELLLRYAITIGLDFDLSKVLKPHELAELDKIKSKDKDTTEIIPKDISDTVKNDEEIEVIPTLLLQDTNNNIIYSDNKKETHKLPRITVESPFVSHSNIENTNDDLFNGNKDLKSFVALTLYDKIDKLLTDITKDTSIEKLEYIKNIIDWYGKNVCNAEILKIRYDNYTVSIK